MNLFWSPEAIADLRELRVRISEDDPAAAQRMALRIIEAVETLIPENPRIGRPGRVSGTRELVVAKTPYIAPYRILGETIEVLRVFHGARRWPERF
jgi:toxin ParE1/3/4